MIPQPHCSLSIVALEDVLSIRFGEIIHHMLSSHCPRIAEYTGQIGTEGSDHHSTRHIRSVSYSPGPTHLVFQEIKGVEQSQSLDEVSEIDGEGIFEQIIRTFFKGNSSESIQIAAIVPP